MGGGEERPAAGGHPGFGAGRSARVLLPVRVSGKATIVAAGAGFVVLAPTLFCQLLFRMDLETEVVTLEAMGGIYNAGLQFPVELPWPPAIRVHA